MCTLNQRYSAFISVIVFLFSFQLADISIAQEADPYSIMLDPGHPSGNPDVLGACGFYEYEIVLEYGLEVYGYFYYDSPDQDIWFPYIVRIDYNTVLNQDRIDMANNSTGMKEDAYGEEIPQGGVSYYFSIHANNSPTDATINGTEIYHALTGSIASRNAAGFILPWYMTAIREYHNASLGHTYSAKSRGVKDDTESDPGFLSVLRETFMPATLIELEFISNEEACGLVFDNNDDYFIAGARALYDANKLLRPYYFDFVDFVIDDDITSYTPVFGSVLIKNTNNQQNQTYDVEGAGAELYITDDFGLDTNVSIERNLTIRSKNGGVINCLPIFAAVNIRMDDGADIMCDVGGTVALADNTKVMMAGDAACLLALGGGTMTIAGSLELYSGFIEVGANSTLEITSGNTPIFRGTSRFNVREGATVKMGNNVSIVIKEGARLEVTGTATNKAKFTSLDGTPNRSDWGTLFIYSSNNTFEHGIVEGSDWGLKFYGTPSPTTGNVVRNSHLHTNDQAIRAEYTELDVYDCTIEDNRHAFVLINNTSQNGGIYLDGNTVRNNDRDGIYSINSVVDIFNTTLDNNGLGNISTYHGIWAVNSSDIALGVRTFSSNSGGYNTIKNNHGAGIYRSSSSYLLGGYYVKPWMYQAGYNSIYGNGTHSGPYNGKDIYNLNIATTDAHKIYWGSSSGPSPGQFYGPVDYSYWLSSPPIDDPFKIAPSPPHVLQETNGTSGLQVLSKTLNAQSADGDKDIKEKLIAQFKATIAKAPGSQQAVDALQNLYSFVRTDWQDKLGQRSRIYGYLNGLSNAHPNLRIGEIAHQLMIVDNMSRENYDDAISVAEAAPSGGSLEAKRDVMVHLISLYLRTGQVQKAKNQFETFKTVFAGDEIYKEFLQDMFKHVDQDLAQPINKSNTTASLPELSDSETIETETEIPAIFELKQNYPNPFNPTTQVPFQLPEDAFVTIKIYSLMGREIKTLIKDTQFAGFHSVQWDGTNDYGQSVASGAYIIRFTANPIGGSNSALVFSNGQRIMKSRKILLLK